jgi:hypothetical protein
MNATKSPIRNHSNRTRRCGSNLRRINDAKLLQKHRNGVQLQKPALVQQETSGRESHPHTRSGKPAPKEAATMRKNEIVSRVPSQSIARVDEQCKNGEKSAPRMDKEVRNNHGTAKKNRVTPNKLRPDQIEAYIAMCMKPEDLPDYVTCCIFDDDDQVSVLSVCDDDFNDGEVLEEAVVPSVSIIVQKQLATTNNNNPDDPWASERAVWLNHNQATTTTTTRVDRWARAGIIQTPMPSGAPVGYYSFSCHELSRRKKR